ncbi:MAG: MBL fold metallo-hydrolase [bacterium]
MGGLLFRQLFDYDTYTYTYLLADTESREAVLIDTVQGQVARDLQLLRELGLRLKYVLDTHVHADHVTGAGEIRRATGAQSGVGAGAGVGCADLALKEGDELTFGRFRLRVISTPGHTDGCLSYFLGDRVFTGDALFVRGTGRTDFQQGSPEKLYDSITGKLFLLPPETLVYPGHDYRGMTVSTIGEEKAFNPRLGGGKRREEFVAIMKGLKLGLPKQIHMAVPANLKCGGLPGQDLPLPEKSCSSGDLVS